MNYDTALYANLGLLYCYDDVNKKRP